MSYVPQDGNAVDLPLAYDYTAPLGDAVALTMPDGKVETTGTARFGESVAAALVVAYGLDGVELTRVVPSTGSDPVGQYTVATDRGPLLLMAHAFDPAAWAGIWKPSTAYAVGDVVFSNGATNSESLALKCTTAGTSGTTEPDWGTQAGSITNDNGVGWETLGRIRDVAPVTNFHVAE